MPFTGQGQILVETQVLPDCGVMGPWGQNNVILQSRAAGVGCSHKQSIVVKRSPALMDTGIKRILEFSADAQIKRREVAKDSPSFTI